MLFFTKRNTHAVYTHKTNNIDKKMINHIMAIVCYGFGFARGILCCKKRKGKSQKIDGFQSFDNPHSAYISY